MGYVVNRETLDVFTFEQAQAVENNEETGLTLGFSEPGLDGTRWAILNTGDMPLVDQRYYKTEIGEVAEAGGAYSAEWETLPCDLSIESIKASKMDEVSAACAAEIESGFDSLALGARHRYSSDRDSQTNMQWNMFAAMVGEDIGHICYDADGVRAERLHTAAQMIQVSRDFGAHIWPKLRKYSEKREAIESAETKEAVLAISWT